MKKRKWLWIRLFFSTALIFLLVKTVNLQEIENIVRDSKPAYLILAYVIAIGDRFLMAFKWNILLQARNIYLSLLEATSVYLKSSFLGLFLPATVGGDALRAYAVAKKGHKGADVVSSIIVERALGFMALFVFALVSITLCLIFFGQSFLQGIWSLFWVFLALLLIFIFAAIVSVNSKGLQWFAGMLKDRNIDLEKLPLGSKLRSVYYSYREYQHNGRALALFFVLSLAENMFKLMWTYVLSLAFSIDVPLPYFFILIPIVLVLVRIPISLNGIGLQEGTFVYFLSLLNVSAASALLLGAASNVIGILSILPGGLLYAISGFEKQGMPQSTENLPIEPREETI